MGFRAMMRSNELILSPTASADILQSLGSVHSRGVPSSHLPSDATASDHLIPLLTSDGGLSVVVSSAPTSAADAASDETASESSDFVADEVDDAAAIEQALDNDALDDQQCVRVVHRLD